jgi:hypothetical protein
MRHNIIFLKQRGEDCPIGAGLAYFSSTILPGINLPSVGQPVRLSLDANPPSTTTFDKR